jgi:hypothetical protein
MDYFIEKLNDSEEEDVIFIKVEDNTTKKRYFKKMYKVKNQLYKVNLEDNFKIIKFGTNEQHQHFKIQ